MKKILSSFIVFLLITLLLLSCEKNIFHRDTSYYSIEIDNRTEQNIYALCKYEEYKKRHNCLLNDSVVYHIVNIAGGENIHFLEMRFDPEKFFCPPTPSPSSFFPKRNMKEKHGRNWSIQVSFCKSITFLEMISAGLVPACHSLQQRRCATW